MNLENKKKYDVYCLVIYDTRQSIKTAITSILNKKKELDNYDVWVHTFSVAYRCLDNSIQDQLEDILEEYEFKKLYN
jgi:hypothetical protein